MISFMLDTKYKVSTLFTLRLNPRHVLFIWYETWHLKGGGGDPFHLIFKVPHFYWSHALYIYI